jgi:hypothetical protein
MSLKNREKRRNPRFFFTLKRGISTQLIKSGNDPTPIPATLLSLSEGGVSLSLDRHYLSRIQEGDLFVLNSNEKNEPVNSLSGTQIEIKHIQNYHIYVNASCGGEFTEIPVDNRDRIHVWLKHRLETGIKEN